MRKSYTLNLIALGIILTLTYACKKEETPIPDPTEGKYANGVFVSCEGPFQTGTGTVSFINRSSKAITNNIFENENGRPLGNIVQSISIWNDKAYIVVNNAGKIEVADAQTFKSSGVITGLSSPRYFEGGTNTKGYISDWSNNVMVVNLQNNSISNTLPTYGNGPERMLKTGNRLFILNAGGWGMDNLLTVYNTDNDQLIDTVRIGDRPTGIVKDAGGKIWILCSGAGFNGWPQTTDTKGRLIQMNPISLQIEKDLEFPASDKHPEQLCVNETGNMLFFLYDNGIYSMTVSATGLPASTFINAQKAFYALGYDAAGKILYATDPLDYQSDGYIFRYSPSTGLLIDSLKAGIIPGNFAYSK